MAPRFVVGHRPIPSWLPLILAAMFATACAPHTQAAPRLSDVQVIGTHNSYHVAPHPSLDALIRSRNAAQADSLAYTHRPLAEQLDRLGIRQVELDIYADPEGGRFARPLGIAAAKSRGLPAMPAPDSSLLSRPGFKILHVPDFDFVPTVATLRQALVDMNRWSTNHPDHVPIFVLLELKSDAAGPEFTQPLPWTAELLTALEQEIREVLPPARLVRPDDVRGRHATLREAVLADGWPLLAETRGRFVLLLDNTDAVRDAYLAPSPTLSGRLLFTSVGEDHPAAAWFKINDVLAEGSRIRDLVKRGFLVRTRADTDTSQARLDEPARRDAAFASGAQLISTDYPEPNLSFSPYAVRFAGDSVARFNPVRLMTLKGSIPLGRRPLDLEDLAAVGLEPFPPSELRHLSARAMRFHEKRRLQEASLDYARLVELDSPTAPSPAQREVMLRLAPILLNHPAEPFPLTDAVAIHHPDRPCIAFHLFWGDDIDFPEDNDPTDHEIIWVTYDPATLHPTKVQTYFHGRIVAAALPENGPSEVRVAVEWGKHGSLPLLGSQLAEEPASLKTHWQRLGRNGIRLPNHPLAAAWPKKFEGDWDEYRRFTRELPLRPVLERRPLLWVGRWGNAILDQFALPYNFAAKTEWPE